MRIFRVRFFVLALVAVLLWSVSASVPVAAAQDDSDIMGSYPLYSLKGATGWINSPPLTAAQLKGKVVLIDFWAYSCINCLRTVPYMEAWAEKYKADGLVVIGVHSPEFEFEKSLPNVQKAVTKFHITYPVALDSNMEIWNAFHNHYWPAHYFIDRNGKLRHVHFGEGEYDQSEKVIQQLLSEKTKNYTPKAVPAGLVSVDGQGAEAPMDRSDIGSPETYVGYERAERFASKGGLKRDAEKFYEAPLQLQLNQWAFDGNWVDHAMRADTRVAGGKILFRFHARDLHLVLGPAADGKPVRFKVSIDGRKPGEDHGADTDADGNGVVKDYRLYQLIRQKAPAGDHKFVIEFLDPGVSAFSFTFG